MGWDSLWFTRTVYKYVRYNNEATTGVMLQLFCLCHIQFHLPYLIRVLIDTVFAIYIRIFRKIPEQSSFSRNAYSAMVAFHECSNQYNIRDLDRGFCCSQKKSRSRPWILVMALFVVVGPGYRATHVPRITSYSQHNNI